MLIKGSRGFVIDNSGAKIVEIFGIIGGSGKKRSYLGEVVRVSVKKAIPNSNVRAGDTYLAIIAGTKYMTQRKDGICVKANGNYFILLDKTGKELLGTGIDTKMYIPREVINKNIHIKKLVSLCKEVI